MASLALAAPMCSTPWPSVLKNVPRPLSQLADSQSTRPELAACHLEKKQGIASSKSSFVVMTEINNGDVERNLD